MSHHLFQGSIVALITPFKEGKVDDVALRQLVEWHIAEGTEGLVPCGTTGESPTLTHKEHFHVIETVIDVAAGRIKIMAGAGSNATHEAIDFVCHAERSGADAALVVTPYYNKPTQEGLIAHYTALNDAVQALPIFIYNIPARSVIDMSVETMGILSQLPHIVGVKDATADLNRVGLQRLACGSDFIQLSGEDGTALGFNAQGGCGCISVTANIVPKLCVEFQRAMLQGDYGHALSLQDRLMLLHSVLFIEANPGPVKFAMAELGLCQEDVRLPLVSPSDRTRTIIREALQVTGIVK